MAIHTESESTMQKGFVKKMDSSGINMMFDTLQKYQYTYPVKSTVRELLSNGIDSVVERQTAVKILKGEAQVSDFFVEKEGDLYKDSKFNPAYYDLKWLSGIDQVELTYHVGSNTKKDYVTITDYGVGLGGERLEKYFSLGYSTKRLSKLPLGKFGLGAKSPLSVGVDMYTIESCYNGQLFRFNIYSQKVDSIIPAFNLETGKPNEYIVFNAGTEDEYKVYYLPTEELNRVTITIEAKKHHKDQYIDAVKSQMLYFDNIKLALEENGVRQFIDYKATILYEDEAIVLSDNQYYTQPHLLLNGVNYGFIDWNELELESKRGNIGIKVQPEEIDVNPSRESVLWTEQTKRMVTERFNNVVDIATKMIQEELKESDIVKWMKTCYQVAGHYSNRADVLGRLANIVDLSTIKPRFILDSNIAFKGAEPLLGMLMKHVTFGHRTNRETGEIRKVINRKIVDNLFEHYNKPFILIKHDERALNRKDKYLLSLYPDGYIAAYEPLTEEKVKESKDDDLMEWFAKKSSKAISVRFQVWDFMSRSKEVQWYDKIEVPEGFTGNDDEEIIQEAQAEVIKEVKEAAITAAERRKQTGKTILHTLSSVSYSRTGSWWDSTLERYVMTAGSYFSFTKLEYPIAKINEWSEDEIYYCNENHAPLMHLVGLITLPRQNNPHSFTDASEAFTRPYAKKEDWENSKYYRLHGKNEMDNAGIKYSGNAYPLLHFFDARVKLIKVAQSNNYLYRDFKPIEQFFVQIKNRKITMSNSLIKWNTARLIRDKLIQCSFLYNFGIINPELAKKYRELCQYVEDFYRHVQPNDKITGLTVATYQDMISHLDNVYRFQQFVQENKDSETVAQLANELFGNKEIQDGMAVDPQALAMLEEITEYSVACGDMLNHMSVLTGCSHKPTKFVDKAEKSTFYISGDLEVEIRKYLEYKGVLGYESSDPVMELEAEVVSEAQEI